MLLGSGEFLPWSGPVEQAALRTAAGDGSVAVLATASAPEGEVVFRRWNSMAISHYRGLGVAANSIEIRNREDAALAENARTVSRASMVFFSGGNPGYLHGVLAGTPVLEAVRELIASGGVYGGCSAGAMVAGAALPTAGGPVRFAFGHGLGLVPDVVFGVHWDAAMMRPWRPLIAGRVPVGLRLMGLSEKTAALSGPEGWSVWGRGVVEWREGGKRSEYGAGETVPV